MAYRNGTYIAFHANGTNYPIDSDIKYYNLIKAWNDNKSDDFEFINSHEKTAAVRDSSKKETLARSLRARLDNSKNMILIIGETTKSDEDWIPYEISYAIDSCKIPIIAAYLGYLNIQAPAQLANLWPIALRTRIETGRANVLHVPFKKLPIMNAINRFNHNNLPNGQGYGLYSLDAYRAWGLA